jgi:hypothetical protein
MVEKVVIVMVHNDGANGLLKCPPRVSIHFRIGKEAGYASQVCQSEQEADDLVVSIRKELQP